MVNELDVGRTGQVVAQDAGKPSESSDACCVPSDRLFINDILIIGARL